MSPDFLKWVALKSFQSTLEIYLVLICMCVVEAREKTTPEVGLPDDRGGHTTLQLTHHFLSTVPSPCVPSFLECPPWVAWIQSQDQQGDRWPPAVQPVCASGSYRYALGRCGVPQGSPSCDAQLNSAVCLPELRTLRGKLTPLCWSHESDLA